MIHGPNSPDRPPRPVSKAAQAGHDSYYDMWRYPQRVAYVLVALVVWGMVLHAFRLLRRWHPEAAIAIMRSPLVSRLVALCRAIAYYRPSRIGEFCFPALGKLLLAASFCVSTVVWCFAIKPYYRVSFEWGSPPLAVRAGMIAMGIFPFLTAVGLKVNPISMLTGISYERLQVYHQWLGHLFLFFSIVHTIPFIIAPLRDGGPRNLKAWYYSKPLYVNGTIALGILVWIICSGSRVFRRMSYEFFVLQHIVTVVAFFGILFVHVMTMLNAHYWLWAGVAVWIFSIVVRAAMVVSSSNFFSRSEVKVEVQSDIDAATRPTEQAERGLELLLITVATNLRWKAGQHIYIRFPTIAPLENHPFTILSLPHPLRTSDSDLVLMVRVESGFTRRLFNRVQKMDHHVESPAALSVTVGGRPASIVKGIEKHEHVEQQFGIPAIPSKSLLTRAVIDGPYGESQDPAVFESCTFIAGGSGITFVLPHLLSLLRRLAQGQRLLTKRVRLVWTMRSRVMMAWSKTYIQELMTLKHRLDIPIALDVFISREGDAVMEKSADFASRLVIKTRPDMSVIMDAELDAAQRDALSSMGVYLCGPQSLNAYVSNIVVGMQWRIARRAAGCVREIDLKCESYHW